MFQIMRRNLVGFETYGLPASETLEDAVSLVKTEIDGIPHAQRFIFHYAQLIATVQYTVGRWHTGPIVTYS